MSKIEGIDFYCDDSQASASARMWLNENNVQYNQLYYSSSAVDKELVLAPLRTWTWAEGAFNVADFPFLTFIEIGTGDPRKWPLHFIAGPDFRALLPWLV
jgi:hypothetical protein